MEQKENEDKKKTAKGKILRFPYACVYVRENA